MEKISQWFKGNKLSFNIKKTNFTLYNKNFLKDEIPLKLPVLMIGNNNIERKSSLEFLGLMLDEHISWTEHVRTVENKIAKNICLIYCITQFLNEERNCIFLIYSFLFDMAWASTYATKLKRVYI